MERAGFVFYRSFWEALRCLPDEDRLKAYDAIVTYGLTGEEMEISGAAQAMFIMSRPAIDANNSRYENGKKGGRPKKATEQEADKNQAETKQKPNENRTETYKEERREKKEEVRKRFIPPTSDEVRAYCREHGYNVDADRFVDFYASKGWLVGKSPMKDWKAAVRNWSKPKDEGKPTTKFSNFTERKEDLDAAMFARIRKERGLA